MAAPDIVLYEGSASVPADSCVIVMSLDQLASMGLTTLLKHHAFRYRHASIRSGELGLMRKPFNKAILLRLLARRRCWLEDESGYKQPISTGRLLHLLVCRLRDSLHGQRALRRFTGQVAEFEDLTLRDASAAFGDGPVLYLRADLVFGIRSGGSVGHIAGVLNQFHEQPHGVRFFTTERIPTVNDAIDTTVIRPGQRFADMPETRSLLFSEHMAGRIMDQWQGEAPRFIYQRYAVNNITGLLLARRFGVPLVIEYNGSEVWINRHWGKALDNEELALRLERLNLLGADLVVVVSQPLADQLVEMGVAPGRVLVNPNGVDPDRYRPDLPCEQVRGVLRLQGRRVIGFIGTFGPWHGAEVLAEAAVRVLQAHPGLRDELAFLFIGDGQAMPRVREIIEAGGIGESCRFTGLVPQEQGPAHMAACDILVSPHVPNPDGTPFFGSPTKLFEYLAMGRPVIASSLDQIGELLHDDHDAVMVPPGDAGALADALLALLNDPPRAERLGGAARQTALQHHTWQRHTKHILDALDRVVTIAGPAHD